MEHIIINSSLSAAIGYNLFLNPPKFAEISAILEPANSTRTDYSYEHMHIYIADMHLKEVNVCIVISE